MPELPEVETVARLVRPHLEGRTITGADVRWERSVGGPTAAAFRDAVAGLRIDRVWRRAKYVVMDTSRDGSRVGALIVHLRMTGRLHVEDAEHDSGKFVRVALPLDDGRELRFIDVRKFGRFVHATDPAEFLAHLGPEPLSDDFSVGWFHRALASRRRVLKPLLLDQTFLAGLGNIYVDEALHVAGLHPLRRSDRVTRAKAALLHDVIRNVLTEAIEREGSSFDTFYRTPEGNPGSYQHQFQVYGRDGKPCRRCERPIQKIVVGQRGTHLCTRCQPVPRPRKVVPTTVTPTVRLAQVADAVAIGRIHTRAWKSAYRGILPDAYLAALDEDERIRRRRAWLEHPPEGVETWVIQTGKRIDGFAVSGPSRGRDTGGRVAEVYAIYLAPKRVGCGLGRQLFAHVLSSLAAEGFHETVVWVLEANVASHHFYERAGFVRDDGHSVYADEGFSLPVVRYRRSLR